MNSADRQEYETEAEPTKSSEHQRPQHKGRRLLIATFIVGILGGVIGAYGLIRYFPGVIPTAKQAVLLQENSAAIEAANKVTPSVVSITSEGTGFSFFGTSQTQKGAGTGIIVSSDGLIMTNNHVIDGAQTLSVFTSDGKEYKNAKVVARDTQADLAFVQIDAKGLKPAQLGDSSQVKVGTRVIAVGNALGQYQNTVTEGIISGLGRPVTAGDEQGQNTEQLQNLLQTDAAINGGNSGGPLVDLLGNVIGINTAVASDAQGVGFAIPINEAKRQLESVKSQGKISKPYLGVRYVPVTKELASQNKLPVTSGAYVTGDANNPAVVSGSPAAKAGFKEGDIITKIGGKSIDADHSLSSLITQYKIGDKVDVKYIRGGKEQTVSVTLEEAPAE